ncbi:hypothetical protein AAHH80_32780, partial [Burkholderia pseudomallei]
MFLWLGLLDGVVYGGFVDLRVFMMVFERDRLVGGVVVPDLLVWGGGVGIGAVRRLYRISGNLAALALV